MRTARRRSRRAQSARAAALPDEFEPLFRKALELVR